MPRKNSLRFVEEQRHDEEVRPSIKQLLNDQNCSQDHAYNTQSKELNNSDSTDSEQNDELGNIIVMNCFVFPNLIELNNDIFSLHVRFYGGKEGTWAYLTKRYLEYASRKDN